MPAADRVREGGLRLMGAGGLLPELTQHLMRSALEAEMDPHLAVEAERVGGRGSRSGGNARNGYRPKKVMTEAHTRTCTHRMKYTPFVSDPGSPQGLGKVDVRLVSVEVGHCRL